MKWLVGFLVTAFIVWLCIALIVADRVEWIKEDAQVDSLALYKAEVADLDSALTKALALQQCYHEELIRVVFECYPDCLYTIPCNGRKVVVR